MVNTSKKLSRPRRVRLGLIIILAIVLIVVFSFFGYRYYQKTKEAASPDAIEQAGSVAENLGQQAGQGVLPSINPQSNPMENAPDTNPMSKTNPFSDIKTNPF